MAGLQAITLDDVRNFYKTHYTQAAMTAVAAGGIDDAFRHDWRKISPPACPRARRTLGIARAEQARRPGTVDRRKPTIATAISLGFPLDITRADDDFYALAVAGSAFGEHRTFNGRLMKSMRGNAV